MWFEQLVDGFWSIPVNLPFTRFNRAIRATSKIQNMIMDIIHEKRSRNNEEASPPKDLIGSLLSMLGDDNATLLSDQEIVDNVRSVMFAGYDTIATLTTFMIRHLASDPVVYAEILKEQEEIDKQKSSSEELLTWDDLAKMKYTWRVALEILRIIPPAFGGFRRTQKDTEFGGYVIPEGWQVFWVANMTHMNDSMFPEPSKFDPSRFENQASIPPYCYIPFGGGQRICPGSEFTRIQTLITMHYLVTQYTWKLCGKDNKFSRDPLLPVPTQGLPIQIEQKNRL
ncbi:Cytochrome p450 [Thalictrum thalictroides]|uniref:Cytochrome p450 n=1 Tax=Thalictrum thalictroides TaxID=46969 RepID=A0A7J6VNA7_THATH|nr:Cytochrome p450 [Thalictrum thalictroides]